MSEAWPAKGGDETRLRLLRLLEHSPALSQRELAAELGVSLGKANYCLRALVNLGWVKLGNFASSRHKRAYAYNLTPAGIAAKSRALSHFLRRKQAEYERLRREIDELHRELNPQRTAEPRNGAEPGAAP